MAVNQNLDPITYEVVKHRLWQINDEQGIIIRTIATSPIVVEGNDFNVGLFTKEGELVVAGPYVLAHVTTMDIVIQNVIANAEEIHDGDMFMVNDPYMGVLHQSDVAVVSPLYWEGEILLWAGNVVHHADVGGIDEGSFCVNARNIHQEPPRYFLKVVDRGKFSREVERTFVLNSRLPDVVALDLRAQVGAVNVVKRRLEELIRERGVGVVQEVMLRSVDYAEERLRERISELPEGTWSTEVYMDGDRVGSERIYRVRLKLEKQGSELFFDYTGSDPQSEGAVNSTYSACYAYTTTPICLFLCGSEIDWNSSLKRCIRVCAPEGTVMNARYPAPVSICSIGFAWLAAIASMKVVAKMLSSSEKHRKLVCPSLGASCNANNLFGVDSEGKQVGALLSDHRGTGAGARSFADGFDHGGAPFSYFIFLVNVESQEWKLPLLYVFRRELQDSGGPGKFRGGLTTISAIVPYKTNRLIWKSQNTCGTEASNASGIEGGYPGAGSQVSVIRESGIWEMLRRGEIPLTYEEFRGKVEHLPSKSDGVLGPDDVFVFYPPGGGGYGDPLDRDPQRLRKDVLKGAVSLEWARKRYGVVFIEGLRVDEEATIQERQRQRRERLGQGSLVHPETSVLEPPTTVEVFRPVGECVEEMKKDGLRILRCGLCHHVFCSVGDGDGKDVTNYALRRERSLAEVGPWLALRWQGHSPNFVLVESLCPSCGVLLDVEERFKSNFDTRRGGG